MHIDGHLLQISDFTHIAKQVYNKNLKEHLIILLQKQQSMIKHLI